MKHTTETWWAILNYGRIVAVEPTRKLAIDAIAGTEPDSRRWWNKHRLRGAVECVRVLVTTQVPTN